MSIEQEKMIVEALPSLYPLQEFEEKAIQTILDALPSAELSTNLAEVGTDCISRQAAINAFNTNIDELVVSGKENADAVERYLNRVIDEIKQLPPILPEPHWIPVEQALPQIGEYVLCETTTRYFGKYHVCKFVDKDKWVDRPHFDWDRHGFPHVIAWMHFKGTEECKKKEVT